MSEGWRPVLDLGPPMTFSTPFDDLPEIIRHAVILATTSGLSYSEALTLMKQAEERPDNLRRIIQENRDILAEHSRLESELRGTRHDLSQIARERDLAIRQRDDRAEQFRKADGHRDLLLTALAEIRTLNPLRGSSKFLTILEKLRQEDEGLYEMIMEADG